MPPQRLRAWRDAIYWIARQDYEMSVADVCDLFPVSTRAVVAGYARVKDTPRALGAVNILRAKSLRQSAGDIDD